MTTQAVAAPGGDFTALLATIGAVAVENTTMVKALTDDSEFQMDEDGKPKLGADGKPMRKDAMRKDDPAMEGEMMGKAFSALMDDGSTVQGIDATEMLKALDTDMGVLRKALPALVGALKVQGNLLKAMQSEMATYRNAGTGRRAVLAVNERTPLAEAGATMAKAEGQLTPAEFMAKALDCSKDGLITSLDCARLDAQMNRGMQPDPSMAALIMGHKKSA